MNEIKYLLIDSKYRNNINDNTSRFRIYLNKQILIKSYCKINYLFMPRTNYLINKNNNNFKIIFNNNDILNLIIPSSNYKPIQLSTYINTISNNLNGLNCQYNEQTYKFEFYSNIPFNLDFTISKFYQLLSLKNQIYSSDNTNKFISNIINFNYPYYINLNLSNIANDVMIGNTLNNQVNFIIPTLSCNFGDIIEYTNNKYDVKMFCNNQKLLYLDVEITDDYNKLYDNNESEFYFILEYDTNYKLNNYIFL